MGEFEGISVNSFLLYTDICSKTAGTSCSEKNKETTINAPYHYSEMSTISCADSGRGLSEGNSENYKDLHGMYSEILILFNYLIALFLGNSCEGRASCILIYIYFYFEKESESFLQI